ncbi:DNA replication and repair protein RecO [Eubacterium ruminantium]|nr:DNA replication and repair protein RecO [Eubacterium ruminantium]
MGFEQEIAEKGIVLSAALYGDYGKRLIILTENLGRITVFAKNIRKQTSRLTAAGQSFVMGTFKLRPGRDSYTLVAADIDNSFLELSYDMDKFSLASYFCEFASYYTREGLAAADELNLLYLAFKALIRDNISDRTVRLIYELKFMDIEGEVPEVASFTRITEEERFVLNNILSLPISRVFSFNLTEELLTGMEKISGSLIRKNVDKEFKSLDVMKNLDVVIKQS